MIAHLMLPSVVFTHLNGAMWHDGLGISLYAKRLERGRFLWPSPADGAVSVTAAQLGYLLAVVRRPRGPGPRAANGKLDVPFAEDERPPQP